MLGHSSPAMIISLQERRLIFVSVLSRCIIILLAAVVSHWIEPFDTSSRVAYNNVPTAEYKSNFDKILRTSLIGFGNWDGIYFLRISTHDYEFDQYHAFFPLLPILTACLRSYSKSIVVLKRGSDPSSSAADIFGVVVSAYPHSIICRDR